MESSIYLRCFGGGGIVAQLDVSARSYKLMPLSFYDRGGFTVSGICNLLRTRNRERLFVALFAYNEKMYLFADGECIDLFDEELSIERNTGLLNSKAIIRRGSREIFRAKYKGLSEVDDVFSYVQSTLDRVPRTVTMKSYVVEPKSMREAGSKS